MALFKISRGDSSNLPSTKTDGWAYFCSDSGGFYIDFEDADGNLQRKQINESDINTMSGKISILESQVDDIKTWVINNIRALAASKADVDHTHNELRRLPAPAISYWYDGEIDGPICRLDISSGENVTYEIYCGKDIDGYDGISYEYLALWDSSIDPSYFHEIEGYIVDQYETYSGKYSMYIIAKGDGENSFDSDRSNIITFTISLPRMEAPVISLGTDGDHIQFVQSTGADTYELWCADCDGSGNQTSDYRLVDTGSISGGTAFATLSELADTKTAKFYVIAKGDGINYDDSPSSNIITWEK